jgi:mitochondrial import receptor subunit TOM40
MSSSNNKPPPAMMMQMPMTPIEQLQNPTSNLTNNNNNVPIDPNTGFLQPLPLLSIPGGGGGATPGLSNSGNNNNNTGTLTPASTPELLPPIGIGMDVEYVPPPTMLNNPGAWDKSDSDAQRILKVDSFDGAKFELQKGFSPLFGTTHTISMGSALHQGQGYYVFGTSYFQNDDVLMGRMDNSGRMDGQWHHTYPTHVDTHRVQASLAPNSIKESHLMCDFEHRGADYTGGLKFGLMEGPLVGISYFQAVTPRIALGGEGYYLDARKVTNVNIRGRYTDNAITACSTLSSTGTISLSLSRRINNRLGLATEIEVAPATLQSHASVGIEALMRQSKFQANISSTGLIQSLLQSIIAPNCSILLCAIVDHRKDIYKFGAGIQLG